MGQLFGNKTNHFWGYRFINIRFHLFKKYELIFLVLNIVSFFALAKVFQDALSTHSFLANFDVYVNIFMANHNTSFLASLAKIISNMGSTLVISLLGAIIGGYFIIEKKWRRGVIMLLSVMSTSVAVFLIKEIFMRARPDNALYFLSDPSLPSGHAAISTSFFIILAYILAHHIHSIMKREIAIVLCILAPLFIGLSRIVLNVHWASDVIAGWALGLFLATSCVLLVRYVSFIFIHKE